MKKILAILLWLPALGYAMDAPLPKAQVYSKKATQELKSEIEWLNEEKIIQLLLNGADPNVKVSGIAYKIYDRQDLYARDFSLIQPERISLITYAVKNNLTNLIRLLLNLGINPNLHDENYFTLLQIAALERNESIMHLLLAHRADPDLISDYQIPPLYIISSCGNARSQANLSFIQLLLDAGANPNTPTLKGENVFFFLSRDFEERQTNASLALLLQFGANPFQKNSVGKSAYMIIQEKLDTAESDEKRAECLKIIEMFNSKGLQKIA